MDTSGLPDDRDVALGFFHATMFSLPLWGLLLTLWYLLAARGESCAGHQAIAHAEGLRGARERSRRGARSASAVTQSRS